MQGIRIFATGACFIFCLAVILTMVSCSEKEEVFVAPPFTANAELVGAPIQIPELDLQLAPPAGWQALDSAQLDNFRKMLGGTDLSREFYPVYPLIALVDSVTGCMIYVAQIEEAETGLQQIAQRYRDFLVPRTKSSAMNEAAYLINGIKTYYYMLHSAEVVNYKLVGETTPGKRFLIEYVIGGVVYAGLEPGVSASLATIKIAETARAEQ